MIYTRLGLAATTLLLGLTACTGHGDSVFRHLSIRDNGDVIAHAGSNDTDARISASGDLAIAGKPVAVTPSQRALLRNYHAHVLQLRADGIATGKAGARTGIHALGTVARGLASGNTDQIDAKVESDASQVKALAAHVCMDLAQIRTTQEAIVAALPAFRPYATVTRDEVSDCHTE